MPPAAAHPTTAATSNRNPHSCLFKSESKPFSLLDQSSSSSSIIPIRIDGSEQDLTLSKSQFLTRHEFLKRRSRRVKQFIRIYRDHYWALMEELKLKHREYYWEYGKSPLLQEHDEVNPRDNCTTVTEENACGSGSNGKNVCEVYGCKAKAMALTRFCHMHILSDAKQKLYKACDLSIKSSITGPILCGKPILRSTVPSYCTLHFQKAEKHMSL